MPHKIPYSKLQNRQTNRVTKNGRKSFSMCASMKTTTKIIISFKWIYNKIQRMFLLLDFQVSTILSTSTSDIMAAIIMADSVAFGMK